MIELVGEVTTGSTGIGRVGKRAVAATLIVALLLSGGSVPLAARGTASSAAGVASRVEETDLRTAPQALPYAWSTLAALAPATEIFVTRRDRKTYRMRFASVDDAAIHVSDSAGPADIPRTDVVRV